MMSINLQVGVKAFLRNREGKYLLLKRSIEKYPVVRGRWDIVGGRIDAGTTLIDNLKREIKEETGLDLTGEPMLIAAQDIIPNSDKHIVRLTYIADIYGEPVLNNIEHDEFKWLTVDEIKAISDMDYYSLQVIDKLE